MDAAAGPIAMAKHLLRETVAACYAFQHWDGVTRTLSEARARVYLDALPPPRRDGQEYPLAELRALRPYALICLPPFLSFSSKFAATGRRFLHGGTLWLYLSRNVPTADYDDPAQIDRDFENFLGLLISSADANQPGLCELAGQAGYLSISTVQLIEHYRGDPDDETARGDYQTAHLSIEWGG